MSSARQNLACSFYPQHSHKKNGICRGCSNRYTTRYRFSRRFRQTEEVRKQYGRITIIEQNLVIEDTKEYLEKNIGIHVEYVDSINNAMSLIC